MTTEYKGDFIQSLKETFERDLERTIYELNEYKSEENLWKIQPDILNSGGNLALHIAGNLLHFIGKEIGGSDYQRDRDYEFAAKNIPREKIVEELEKAKLEINRTLDGLTTEDLSKDYPGQFRVETSIYYMLLHLAIHLGYHYGQLNYHRRLLDT